MDFDLTWILLGLPVAFVLGWLASRLDLRQLRIENRQAPKAYFKGLNFLLNEQQDQAIDAFIEAVQNDPDTSELHFALGNLFRRRGEYDRAVRVHEHLLSRGDLSRTDRERAQHALALDFLKAGLLDRAEDALQRLEGTPFEAPARLALLGWSNGGSTVLSATNLNHSEVASSVVRPRFSVAFYPGCATEARRGYRPVSDTLVLVGLADDWTPTAPCQALVSDDLGAGVRVEAFDGAHHGFDGRAALTLRRDVPNGVNPGEGVHLGAHPEAREQSRRIMLQALQQAFAR
mgnify:CR=1 FL=1